MTNFDRGGLKVGASLDRDGDLGFYTEGGETAYLTRDALVALREHITAVLGDGPPDPADPALHRLRVVPSGPNRAEALKLAEEMVTRLAPATNARGYADGVSPLKERVSAILQTADYLTKEAA
ncbi:hypothetical protein [Micromonospora sp. NPDC023956]|uniref:hypothetical protein n=1 Tax=Micromonospora sp. NPDC023956 TaxID=3155722 RepID=UPI0033D7956B